MEPDRAQSVAEDCARRLGLTMSELLSIVRTAPKRYKLYNIPKRSGGDRLICHPSRELKSIQRYITKVWLAGVSSHPASTAYGKGDSIRANAERHAHSRVIVKADFLNFFYSIKVADWIALARSRFPALTESDIVFIAYATFWGQGGWEPVCLSIGAPSSPKLSNLIMVEFDTWMTDSCQAQGIVYTRYADDMTFSSTGHLDKIFVEKMIVDALNQTRSPSLRINVDKSILASRAQNRTITGLVLTPEGKVSLGRDRKRMIRAAVHQALKGERAGERSKTRGLIAFAKGAEPDFFASLERTYGAEAIRRLLAGG